MCVCCFGGEGGGGGLLARGEAAGGVRVTRGKCGECAAGRADQKALLWREADSADGALCHLISQHHLCPPLGARECAMLVYRNLKKLRVCLMLKTDIQVATWPFLRGFRMA